MANDCKTLRVSCVVKILEVLTRSHACQEVLHDIITTNIMPAHTADPCINLYYSGRLKMK